MMFPGMSVEYVVVDDETAADCAALLESIKPPPEVPPPCWDAPPVDPDRAMAAVRALCG